VNEAKTLLLSETGVELLPDGSTAVNVGPIVRALAFLTEGRGEDRGIDESGNPLPDLMSLAFDVIEAIILGGKKAEYFRQVKHDLEAQNTEARSSLKLAKLARRVHAPAPATALDLAAESVEALLGELSSRTLDPEAARKLELALESFRAFGVDRWVSATAQLLVAVTTLAPAGAPDETPSPPRRRTKAGRGARKKASAVASPAKPKKRRAARRVRPEPPAVVVPARKKKKKAPKRGRR